MEEEIWNNESRSGRSSIRLLLTVFDETLSNVLVDSLEKEGFHVHDTMDLDDAYGYLRGNEPEVFLLDTEMPDGESGLDWAEDHHSEIMATEALVLLLSGAPPTDKEREREHSLSNVFFIPRPNESASTQATLVRQLERALALTGRVYIDAREPERSQDDSDRRIEEPNGGFAYRFHPLPARGSFEDMSFLELICDCYATCQSGRLHLYRDGVEKKIFLLGGYPIYVQSNQPDESLFERIRQDKLLDPSTLEFMQSEMQLGDLRASRIIVEKNLIRSANLHSLLTGAFVNRLKGLFSWKTGKFRLDASGAFGERDYSFSISPARVIIDGARQGSDEETLSRCLDVTPDMVPYGRDSALWVSGELQLTKLEVIIARQLMSKRSVVEIAEVTGESVEYVEKLLTGFFLLGMVGFKPPRPAKKPAIAKPSLPPPPMRLTPRPPSVPEFGQIVAELSRIAGTDFFTMLEVERDVPMDEIHRVFREKIKPFRSDVLTQLHEDDRQAGEEVARMLTEAYLVLSNPEHRGLYLSDLENPVLTVEEAAFWARERRLETRHSPIPGSPVSRWNLTPPPESPPQQPATLTPIPPPPPLESSPIPRSPAPRESEPPPRRESEPPPRRAATTHPSIEQAHEHYLQDAQDALDQDDMGKAISLLKAGLARKRNDPALLAWYEWTLFRKDPHTNAYRALSQLETARQSAPDLADIRLLMARISEFTGDYESAQKHYRSVEKGSDAPIEYRREARAFGRRLKEAEARQKEAEKKDIVEILNEDVGDLFRHYVLGDKKDAKK